MNPRLFGFEKKTDDEIIISTGPYAGVYTKGEKLGGGEFGDVDRYTNTKLAKSFAVKKIRNFSTSPKEYANYLRKGFEERGLTAYMLGFCESCLFENQIYLLMPEITPKGQLYQLTSQEPDESKKIAIVRDGLKTVDEMHQRKVTHGDLARNLIVNLETGKIHVIDFGAPSKKHIKSSVEMAKYIDNDKWAVLNHGYAALLNPFFSLKKAKPISPKKMAQIRQLHQESAVLSLPQIISELDKIKESKDGPLTEKEKTILEKPYKPTSFHHSVKRSAIPLSRSYSLGLFEKEQKPLPQSQAQTRPLRRRGSDFGL